MENELFGRPGRYAMRVDVPARGARLDLDGLGGDLCWYGLAWLWRLRILIGRLFGERLRLHRPDAVTVGSTVDWWTVASVDDTHLVLHTDQWFTGEAWLGYRIEDGVLTQVGALRPNGVIGRVYWWAVYPIHFVVFRVMARRQARRSR
ncbi:DUF2867 domain-containing protein [Actinokineospora fastidiosa]|uniref:DUF2867 domain-containing protein n=1 Tax=Actinokineospora fastidiosa TaxID=1816 RepID=A0A918LBJ1_9PSEU|nr:DUF2867 domain-containing protein [Actinokineospora fastidiosa]GGS26470.1 hypothetical protein GCM10010171_19970 [Actinokineospora fastidiosa]